MNKAYKTAVTLSRETARSKEECLHIVRKFRREFDVVEVGIEELATKLIQGYMVIPADMENHKKDGFVSSDLIFVDVDSSSLSAMGVVSMLARHGLEPTITYHTYSSTVDQERFRLVFQLSETIDDANVYQGLIYGLHEVLNSIGIKTDKQTRDLNRVSFGGKTLVHLNVDAIVDIDTLPAVQAMKESAPTVQLNLDIETGYEIVEMLKKGDWEGLQETVKVKLPDNFFELSFIEKLNSIEITEFFQVPSGNISCFFHEDNKPSVGIKHTGKNQMYHCFSCGEKLNLVSLIGKLIGGTVHDAIQALEVILQVKFGTEYQERMLKVSHQHKRQVRNQLETEYPELYAWMERSNLTGFYLALIEIGLDLVTDQPLNSENELTFFTSQRKLIEQLKPFGLAGTKSIDIIGKKINLLSEVGLLIKEADVENKSYIEKAEAYKKAQGFRFRTNYITIPMSADVLSHANAMVVKRKEDGVRNGYTSSTQTFNQDEVLAGKVYSQSDMDAIEKVVRAEQDMLLELGMQLVDDQGFFTEQMMIEKLMEMGYKKFKAEKMAGSYRPYLLGYFELVTVTAKVKEEKGLPVHLKSRQKIYLKF